MNHERDACGRKSVFIMLLAVIVMHVGLTRATAKFRYNSVNNKGRIYVDVCQTSLQKVTAGECTSTTRTGPTGGCVTIAVPVTLRDNATRQKCGVKKLQTDREEYLVTVRSHAHEQIVWNTDRTYTIVCDFDKKPSQSLVAFVNIDGETRRPLESTSDATTGSSRIRVAFPTLLSLSSLALLWRRVVAV